MKPLPNTNHANATASAHLGFFSAAITALATIVTFAIALLTPPISGPFATNPIGYPFSDVLARFPRDYIWMYPAMLLMLAYIVMAVCILYAASEDKKIWAHLGMIFATMAGAVIFTNYFLQVSIVQPSLLNGETDGIALLTQYNPHGLFVVLEEIGYSLMSLSFLFTAPVFSEKNKLDAAIRRILYGAFLLSLLAFALINILYGIHREYFYEVAVISIDFLALISWTTLLSIRFSRHAKGWRDASA